MKYILFAFFISLSFTACAAEQETHDFSGKWTLNNADGYFGGEMTISDCTDKQCKFKLQSWYDLHICDVSGALVFKDTESAEYTSQKYNYDRKTDIESYLPVGIIFKSLPDGNMNLHYSNTDSYFAFCGLNATVEGTWVKSDINTP